MLLDLQETIQLYDSSSYTDLPSLINRLSHILLYESSSISTRIRRGIARYRLRDLSNALDDLDSAIELSTRSRIREGEDGREVEEEGEIDLDALRMRALVREEMQYVHFAYSRRAGMTVLTSLSTHSDTLSALSDLEHLLSLSPNDVLALSLRAKLRGNSGDLEGAREDLAETNLAVRNDLAYRSRLGDGECDLEYLVSLSTLESVCHQPDLGV